MALTLNIGKCTLLGNYRENNEDSIDVKQFPDMTVCLVADGMGGQAAGEVASKRAIEIIPRELKKHISGVVGNEETKSIIRRSILQANEEIIAMAALDRELVAMLARARAHAEVPVALGFGIGDPAQAAAAADAGAEGVIIGTRLVRAAGQEPDPVSAVAGLVRSFAAALH